MIAISCYRVCPRPPPSNIGSAYYQQSRIMESENKSIGLPIDPHCHTICDLQIFIQSYQQQGFFKIKIIITYFNCAYSDPTYPDLGERTASTIHRAHLVLASILPRHPYGGWAGERPLW
jgi:hypothetical protein